MHPLITRMRSLFKTMHSRRPEVRKSPKWMHSRRPEVRKSSKWWWKSVFLVHNLTRFWRLGGHDRVFVYTVAASLFPSYFEHYGRKSPLAINLSLPDWNQEPTFNTIMRHITQNVQNKKLIQSFPVLHQFASNSLRKTNVHLLYVWHVLHFFVNWSQIA